MADLYPDIPQKDLRWLDQFDTETGTALTDSAASAVLAWLPEAARTRLEQGKTYVMTLSSAAGLEVVSITKGASRLDLIRSLEGTQAQAWPAGSRLFQSFTAHQIGYLVAQAAKVPWAPEDEFGIYLGTMEQGDGLYEPELYHIYAAPAADIIDSVAWKTTATQTPHTYRDDAGYYNQQAVADGNELGIHPAFNACANYRGGGHDDWYLPANDELAALKASGDPGFSGYLWTSHSPSSGTGTTWQRQATIMTWSTGAFAAMTKTSAYKVVPFRRIKA
jgi:hypothetical protein